jgi:hypothetical protein
MPKSFSLIILFVLGVLTPMQAQFGKFSHELGLIVGPVFFQSDYGERYNFDTNVGNSGYGIGLIHYLNFSYRADCNCYNPDTYFNDHFKLRSEISFNKTTLKHYGQYVTDEKVATSLVAKQLKAMEGSTAVTNIGVQLEFYPLSIRDFTATDGAFAPFISLGGQFSFYSPTATSSLGRLGTPLTTPKKYLDPSDGEKYGFTNESGTVWSIVSSLGTRYKLNPRADLIADARIQYYFSNWVDGLNPNPDVYKENKANDWNLWINFGYIYYLN